MDILQTTNPTWGFYGAFSHHATDPSVAWPLASEAIAKATGCPVVSQFEICFSAFRLIS